MGPSPFIIEIGTLVLFIVVLIAGYGSHRRALDKESGKNRMKNQQIAALSTELKALKTEFHRKSEIAEQFPRITKKMTEKLPLDAYPAIAVRSVKDFLHALKVGYFAPAENSSDYTLVVGAGFPPGWPGTVRIRPDEGILGMALQKRVVVSRTDPDSSSGRRSPGSSLEKMGVEPDFVAPVFGVSGTLGALVIEGCPFPIEEERIYVSMLADLLSMALQNAMHLDPKREGMWVDQLTGVCNRAHFLLRFENEVRRTENYRQTLALLMFDIDGFKKVNDTYGHHAGDVVIKSMADIVRRNTRGSDLVGRYGGDEFIVLLTSTTEEKAASFAENLREKISTTDIAIPGTEVPIRITISGGIAMFPIHGQSTTDLFRAADKALYESKDRGKNRILLATTARLDGGFAKGAAADPDVQPVRDVPVDPGSDAPGHLLGGLGGVLDP